MASKAEKLRLKRRTANAGRPRKEDAERYPSGQIKHTWTEQEARSVVIEARARVHQIGANENMQESGYTAGRMKIDGKISDEQLKAGNEYAEIVTRYYRSVGIPMPSARAQSFGQVRGHDGEESADRATRARIATNRMMHTEGVLLRCIDGPQVKQTCYNLFVMDHDALRLMPSRQLRWLKRGLDAIIRDRDLRSSGKAAKDIPSSDFASG